MIHYLVVVCVLVLTFTLHGCSGLTGTNAYVNNQYGKAINPANKLAIVPLMRLGPALPCSGNCPKLEPLTDEHFERTFGGFSAKISLVSLAKSRSFFDANPVIFDQLLGKKYSEQELDNNPTLKTVLRNNGLASLRDELDAADLLLIPVRMDFVPKLGRLFGYSEFRLYDLRSGSMIYVSSRNLNINLTDEAGRGLMAFAHIGYAATDFERLYLNK